MADTPRLEPTPVVHKPQPVQFVRNTIKKGEAALPAFAKNAALTAATAVLFRADPIRKEAAGYRGQLNTPVFDQVQIQAGSYFELEDIDGKFAIEYEGVIMQNMLMDVSMSKNVVKTNIQGLSGTVKEYIADGDYVINMTGNIIGVTNGNSTQDIGQVYPRIDTDRVIQICKVPQSITITSAFLQSFGINEVVIIDQKFAEKEGYRNEQPFQITMLSDQPINLEEV